MQVDWLWLSVVVLIWVAWFGFIGGVAGALVGGGREERSLPVNAGIGFLGTVLGGLIWAFISGEEFEVGTGGLLAALGGSVVLVMVWTAVQRGRYPASGSEFGAR